MACGRLEVSEAPLRRGSVGRFGASLRQGSGRLRPQVRSTPVSMNREQLFHVPHRRLSPRGAGDMRDRISGFLVSRLLALAITSPLVLDLLRLIWAAAGRGLSPR